MKTVVTGAAGLIGNHLVRRLVSEGRDVVCVDDFSRGHARNLADLECGLDLRTADLRDYAQTRTAFEDAECVFHLAARVGSVEMLHGSDDAELAALQTNLLIDTNVLRACVAHAVRRVVYASSVSVYPIERQGGQGVVLGEDDLASINPEGGYGWAKLLGEVQLGYMHGMDIGIARVFNVFGEGEEPDEYAHAVPALLRKAARYPHEDFVVWGDGAQTRDLLYVSDAVEALLRLEARASRPPVIVNIGSGTTVRIRELVDTIIRVSGKPIAPLYDTSKPVGPISRTADIARARQILDWEPRVALEEALERTYRWVEARVRAA